jgi:hypothetical protein
MPANDLFSVELLVNGQPLQEYKPIAGDKLFRKAGETFPLSPLYDRLAYIEAAPGSEFSIRITYKGDTALSASHAFVIILVIDGVDSDLFIFYKPAELTERFYGRRSSGAQDMQQQYSINFNEIKGCTFLQLSLLRMRLTNKKGE